MTTDIWQMSDAEFLRGFEACLLPAETFDHRAHVRMAWLYLRSCGMDRGAARIAEGLRAFATAHGVPEKYKESITRQWIARLGAALAEHPEAAEFAQFLAKNPLLVKADVTPDRAHATSTSSRPCDTGAIAQPVASAPQVSAAPSS